MQNIGLRSSVVEVSLIYQLTTCPEITALIKETCDIFLSVDDDYKQNFEEELIAISNVLKYVEAKTHSSKTMT